MEQISRTYSYPESDLKGDIEYFRNGTNRAPNGELKVFAKLGFCPSVVLVEASILTSIPIEMEVKIEPLGCKWRRNFNCDGIRKKSEMKLDGTVQAVQDLGELNGQTCK